MGKRIKSEKKGGGEESKFIEEYTPLVKITLSSDSQLFLDLE
jgi:hypothetical protein